MSQKKIKNRRLKQYFDCLDIKGLPLSRSNQASCSPDSMISGVSRLLSLQNKKPCQARLLQMKKNQNYKINIIHVNKKPCQAQLLQPKINQNYKIIQIQKKNQKHQLNFKNSFITI